LVDYSSSINPSEYSDSISPHCSSDNLRAFAVILSMCLSSSVTGHHPSNGWPYKSHGSQSKF
jgi:hypothetical protein